MNPSGVVSSLNGTVYPYGSSYLEVILHRLPASVVLSAPGQCVLQPFVGSVNSATIFGWDEGQILFDSLAMAPFGDWQGLNIFDLHFFFNCRESSWNTGLDTDGQFYNIVTSSGANKPIGEIDFAVDLLSIIPANA